MVYKLWILYYICYRPNPHTMKKLFIPIIVILLGLTFQMANGQCTPGNAITCPDPENNGQVCPDSLAVGYYNLPYSQEITILPPSYFVVIGDTVNLHHVTLIDIGNLPPGLSWESNAPNNEFMAGEYYCILIDGTPSDSGVYQISIIVEVFVEILPSLPPVSAGQIEDSTLAMYILPESTGIDEQIANTFSVTESSPNPFSNKTSIGYHVTEKQTVRIHVYDMCGQCIHENKITANPGLNQYLFEADELGSGMYICTLTTAKAKQTIKLIKR